MQVFLVVLRFRIIHTLIFSYIYLCTLFLLFMQLIHQFEKVRILSEKTYLFSLRHLLSSSLDPGLPDGVYSNRLCLLVH